MKPTRHLLSAASLGLALAATAASADTWPSKPITFIVPTAPAGSTDIMARITSATGTKSLVGFHLICGKSAGLPTW